MKKKIEIWVEGKSIEFETSKGWTVEETVRVLSGLLSEILHSNKIKVLYTPSRQNLIKLTKDGEETVRGRTIRNKMKIKTR